MVKSFFYILSGFILLFVSGLHGGELPMSDTAPDSSSPAGIGCITTAPSAERPVGNDYFTPPTATAIPEYGGCDIGGAVIRLLPQIRFLSCGRHTIFSTASGICGAARKRLCAEIRLTGGFNPTTFSNSCRYHITLECIRI